MTALRMKSSRPPFSVRCLVLPAPLTQTPLDTPWEEVCCAVATLNQHRPNEVSHLTPSSLRPSHGCQSHNERPSISSAWLTHFDSWESLGPVRSKLPLSKCHHQRIHQPYLWICPFSLQTIQNLQKFFLACALHVSALRLPKSTFAHNHTSKHLLHKRMFSLSSYQRPEVIRLSVSGRGPALCSLMALWVMNSVSPRCWWACPLTYWPKTLLMWTGPHS